MKTIDLNADLGEADTADWAKSEYDMLQYISSANIACGGHAGTKQTMKRIVSGAILNGVSIGAHPAYPDKVHFGRKSLTLGTDISRENLQASLLEQIITLSEIASKETSRVSYIKPHGALYNDAVNDPEKADILADVISTIDPALIFMGAPNSEMGRAAKRFGLSFIAEGFIDRRYTDDGHLLSRSEEGAVISNQEERINQAKSLISKQSVTTHSGVSLSLDVQTLCLHGDSQGAVETARRLRQEIENMDVRIAAFANAA